MLDREGKKKRKKKERPGLLVSRPLQDYKPQWTTTTPFFSNIAALGARVRRAMTFRRRHEGQTMTPLTQFDTPLHPHLLNPTPVNMKKKKSCLLLTGMSVCSQWVEFEPCIDYSKATPPQNPLQCLVDCLYTHTHKYRLCLYLMQILHFLWDIFTDSFLAQWKATKTSKGLLRLAGAHRVVWHVHSVFFLWLKSQ